jgi:LysR family transcriptional regulator, transcriptional activator of the cysJI operon
MENFRLRVFRAVARHRNFRMAAEELLLTQPAVSQQVKALEAELGTALFRRSAGQVALTAAGEMLLPYAERLAALAAEAEAAVKSSVGTPGGSLSVGASQTIGQYLLPQLIATFAAAYPAIAISTVSGNTSQVIDALLDGRTQIGLIEGPAMRSGVHVEAFAEDELVLVAPAGHPWADERIAAAMLPEATLLMREQGSGSRRVAERALVASGIPLKTLQLGITFDSTEALLSAVEAGLGLAFVSRWAVRNQFALRTLRPVHVDGLKLARELSVVTVSGPEPEGPAGLFRSFLLREKAATRHS